MKLVLLLLIVVGCGRSTFSSKGGEEIIPIKKREYNGCQTVQTIWGQVDVCRFADESGYACEKDLDELLGQ